MSSPNDSKNAKGKKKADETSKADTNNRTNNSSTSLDSNNTGSTTPRATPRATPTSTPGSNVNTSSSSTPTRPPVTSATPRPVPPIDHARFLASYNFMPSASQTQPTPSVATRTLPTLSGAPFSLEGIFGELQRRFTRLSEKERLIADQEKTMVSREKAVRDGQKLVVEAAERNKSEIETARKQKRISNAVWNTAAKVEKENEEEKERLSGIEADLKERLADLERREAAFERRASIHQQFASDALGAALDAVGRTAPTHQIQDPMSSAGDLSSSFNLFQQYSDKLFSSAVVDPPRGRTLSSPHILEHQLLSTVPSDMPFRSRSNQSSPIPIRPRNIHARRVSSENLSLASPTPRRALREEDLRRIEEFGSVPGDVYDSSGEEQGGESGAGEKEQEQVEAEVVQRPRERSVRRVSRNENLRR